MKYKLVLITWIDAQSGNEWETKDKTMTWANEDCKIMEIGWEIGETEKYYIICSQIGIDGDLGNKTKIPKKWIINKQRIKL